jgi:flagellar FliL protein
LSGLADPLLHRMKNEKKTTEDASSVVPTAVYYDLPEMLVNLDTDGSRQYFMKIQVSLELKSALDAPKIEAVMPIIIDKFQTFLRQLRIEDLQGSADVLKIQEELRVRVNETIKPTEISGVLLRDLLVQ